MAKPEAFIRMVTTEAHISKANMVSPLSWHKSDFDFWPLALGTIHSRRRQIFTIFDPYPPTVGSFLLLSVGKFGKFLTPYPPKRCRRLKWMVPLSCPRAVSGLSHGYPRAVPGLF